MKNLKISARIIIVFLSIGIVGISILGILSFQQSKSELMTKSYEQLTAIREIKKSQIEGFFSERFGDIKVYADNKAVQQAASKFIHAFDSGGMNSDLYQQLDKQEGKKLKYYVDEYGYYDLFIISPNGDVVYTAAKEADLGQNVASGSLAGSGLGEAFTKGKTTFSLIDFQWYDVSNEPASFIAGPIKDNDGNFIGVLAYQISLIAINKIMQERSGMGETGETYLVGSDMLMRSDSYLDPTGHSVKASFAGTVEKNGVNTESARNAIAGQSNAEIVIDYNGNPVLSAYTPVKVGGLSWAMMAEIDEAEVLTPVRSLAGKILLVALFIITAIIGIGIGFARSIARPLQQGVDFANALANGDLTATINIDQKDEIGQLANALSGMGTRLREIVENILASAGTISAASEQMSSTSQQLSQGASEQASSVEEVSSSMEEMVANIQQNTDSAQTTQNISLNAAKGVQEGSEATNTAVEGMRNIAEKIQFINDIAFQTNILALNAAVEAARAGEHGKGFAVVAAEVRKLAERSKVAADEIEELSKNGVTVAENAGSKLREITPEIERTAQLVQEIAAASLEQNTGADQVNNAMQQLNSLTQQNAAASEEMATGAEELSAQALQLKEIMQFFKTSNGSMTNFLGSQRTTSKKVINIEKKTEPAIESTNAKSLVLDEQEAIDKEFENF